MFLYPLVQIWPVLMPTLPPHGHWRYLSSLIHPHRFLCQNLPFLMTQSQPVGFSFQHDIQSPPLWLPLHYIPLADRPVCAVEELRHPQPWKSWVCVCNKCRQTGGEHAWLIPKITVQSTISSVFCFVCFCGFTANTLIRNRFLFRRKSRYQNIPSRF